jgi:hypothetical protein
LIEKSFADHAKTMEHAAQGLTPQERETLLVLLKKLGLRAQELLAQTSKSSRKKL